MQNFFKTSLGLAVIFSALVVLSSCGGSDDPGPSNVIDDATGIKVDLDWTTGGSVNDALQQSDLDLRIYKNGTKVLYSESGSSFERIEFDPDLYADGTYTVVIRMYETSANVNYTATVNGVTVAKPYTFTSNFEANSEQREVQAITIVKSGSKYTMTTVD